MAVRMMRVRLADAGRLLRDRAYARLAALWRDGVRPGEEAEAGRVFHGLAEWEAAGGTPLETVLARLPRDLAAAIRRALADILAAENPAASGCGDEVRS